MSKAVLRLKRHGQGLAEYGLILVVIAAVVALILFFLGETVTNMYSMIEAAMPPPRPLR